MWPTSVEASRFYTFAFSPGILLFVVLSCSLWVTVVPDALPEPAPEPYPGLGAGASPMLLDSLVKRLPQKGDKKEILISYLAAVPTLLGEIDQYLLNISASNSAQSSSKDRENFSKKLNQIVHCLTTDSYVSVVSGALVAAIVEINNDEELIPDYQLKYVFGNTCGNDSHSTRLFMEHWQAGARVFIGPEKNCKTEAAMAGSQNLPLISYRCNDQDISRDDYHYRTFARTVPPAGEIFKAFMSLMKQYDWRKFSVVYDVKKGHSKNELFETLKRMVEAENKFEEHKFEIMNVSRLEFSKMDISSQQDIQSIVHAIESTKQTTRIYLTFDNVRLFRTMLSIMGEMGLTEKGYMLIYVDTNYDWLNVYHAMNNHFIRNTMTYLHQSWDANNSSDRKMLDYAQSALSIIPTPVKLNSNRFYNFWKKAGDYMHYFGVQKTDNLKGNRIACYLYDAVYLYARAIHELVEEYGSDSAYDPTADGKAIIDRIVNKKYRSIQGFDMRIDERGNSKGNFSLLSWQRVAPVMNKSDPKYYPLDHALDVSAIFVEAPDKDRLPNLAFKSGLKIQWPNAQNKPPLDMPECGFYGELCRQKGFLNTMTIALLACFAVTGVIVGGFALRNRRFEKELSSIWRIDQFEVRRVVGGVNNNESTASLINADIMQMKKTNNPWWCRSAKQGTGMRGLASYKGTLVGLKDLMYGRKPKELTREARKELRAMRQLSHPNVNNFLGIVVCQQSVTVVREYCSKGSLHDILRNDDLKLDHMYVASFVDDLVKGMCYIHDSELKMHGNLKSTNCLITSRWTLQIADFGLRELRDSILYDRNFSIWENFLWTAPEVMTINGSVPLTLPPTQKADVYSFGVIFHEIITREGPYKIYVQRGDVNGESIPRKDFEEQALVEQTVRRVYSDPYFRPDTEELEVQNYVKEVMQACWHHDPSQRPEFKSGIRNKLKPLFYQIYKQNIMDHMVLMMEKYQTQLEDLVDERTIELKDEQRRSQHLLQRMLPSSVAEQLLAGQDVIPEAFPPVTIYFSDIVGFTTISGESTPMEVVTFLNKLYTLFDSIIRRYDVYKVETIGDAYMVVSGVPQYKTMEYHAEQIAMMAIHILSAVRSFSIPHRGAEQLMIRIGIHTGPCVAGVVGKTMPRYTLFGDTVNTASRMESNGEALRIHCSSSTQKVLASIDQGFLLEERGSMAIKGKGQMTTYWLNGRTGYEFTETIEDKMVVPDIFPRQNLKHRGSSWGVNRESSLSLATEKSSQLMKRQSAALNRNHQESLFAPGAFTSRGTSSREMPRLYEDDRESQTASLFGGPTKVTSGRKRSTASKYNGFSASRVFASTISNASTAPRPSRQATFEHDTLALRKRSTSLPDGEKLNLEFMETINNNNSVPVIPNSEPGVLFRRASGCSFQSESPSQSQYPSYRDLTSAPHQRKRGIATVFPIRKRSLSCGDAVSPKVSPEDTAVAVTATASPRPASRTIDCSVRLRASSPDEIVFQEDDEHALIGSDTFFLSNGTSSRSEDGLRSCPQPRRKNKTSFLRDPSPLTKRFRDASPFGMKKNFWSSNRSNEHHTSSPADSISRLFRRFRGAGNNEYADLNDYAEEEAYELKDVKLDSGRVNRSVSCSPVEGGNSTDNSEPLLTAPKEMSTSTATSC